MIASGAMDTPQGKRLDVENQWFSIRKMIYNRWILMDFLHL
jgi:hypothetical protein